jgi:4-amino-4-deoxy-L-arabinose transferase-like glycosyltransferase
MHDPWRSVGAASALALLLLAGSIVFWPIIPLDETRYVSVAWEMHLRGDFLVPYLNGAAYSHKPPLLFWLMNAGWSLFGVNAWWPRAISALFAVLSAPLVALMALRLWPGGRDIAAIAPLLLQATALWMALTTAIMFDIALAFFVLAALLGVLRAANGARGGWLLYGTGLGLGILAKGPVAFLHVVPVVLLAPLWKRTAGGSWLRWYGGFALGVTFAAAIALAWAVPAALRGGEQYASAILWTQSAERVVHSFAHSHPWWWYVPLVPLTLLPWVFWKPVWTALGKLRSDKADPGMRFCLTWALSTLVLLSCVSGKQIHYLLPLLPAAVLLIGRGLVAVEGAAVRVPKIAFASVTAAAVLCAIALTVLAPRGFDVTDMAQRLKQLETAGTPVAHIGKYHGQYQFAGRLERPLDVIGAGEIGRWAAAHPEGRLVAYFRPPHGDEISGEYEQRYRGRRVLLMTAAVAAERLQTDAECDCPAVDH